MVVPCRVGLEGERVRVMGIEGVDMVRGGGGGFEEGMER